MGDYADLLARKEGFMRIKVTVEVDASSNITLEEGKKLLQLAQAGILREHVDRLLCSGSVPVGAFISGMTFSSYADFVAEKK